MSRRKTGSKFTCLRQSTELKAFFQSESILINYLTLFFFPGLLEEGEDFTEFRNRVVELIKDVVFIVGSANVFKHMFAFLATCHQSNSWESSEAALFIMVRFIWVAFLCKIVKVA